ncbi:autophagy associated ubiquitin-like modifier Atg12 [Schizosaccharomyces japonicus yFS275]|uniref:Ubiquitin-like protein ATG12 n=1 Tax=Schizosaccharomyces japonicus (strain yFS275 / FY16936) TaxID=402676 RepID=T0S339_SCHJY|nr:autophagy associated ubiquitin-like modifier Atg12 [Schizosaccharomyces japonicus yFS275]EQC53036.1 autophagy associated ubiquitin-like modifier Atg12 [Schizosaccharomyces japonicus yFS275]
MSTQEKNNISEETNEDLKTSATASILLKRLPEDTASILDSYKSRGNEKVTLRFMPIGRTPTLKTAVFTISGNQKFEVIIKFIKKQLSMRKDASLYLFINSCFSPAPDERIGNLFSSFKTNDCLLIQYCTNVAFG